MHLSADNVLAVANVSALKTYAKLAWWAQLSVAGCNKPDRLPPITLKADSISWKGTSRSIHLLQHAGREINCVSECDKLCCRPSSVSQPWWLPPQLPPRSSEEGLEVLESPQPGSVVLPPLELPPLPIPSPTGFAGLGLAPVLLEELAMLLPPMQWPPL